MSSTDARQVALDVLLAVDRGGASDRSLDAALRRSGLPQRERALATELVYGVLRRRQSLDGRIAPYSKRPLEDLDAAVLSALRLGVYQIDMLDRVPSHAAVSATVDAVKAHNKGASGFVNGVLRALLRGGAAGTPVGRGADPLADVPAWWARRWHDRQGAIDWLAASLEPTPLVLRPHSGVMPTHDLMAALVQEDIEVEPAAHAPGALRVVRGNPVASPLLRRGAFALRGEASQLVAALLPVTAGELVWDACAGRGGKTVQIAEDAAPRCVVASDVSAWRAVACGREARQAQVRQVRPVVADLTAPAPFRAAFSSVLVDAPCSGLGTVRRRPELKWRNTPDRLARLARLQTTILGNVADAVAPGGALLYATCSTEAEENEEVVAAVLARRGDLEARPVELPPGVDAAFVGSDGFFRTYPQCVDMDGFFAALLVKTR